MGNFALQTGHEVRLAVLRGGAQIDRVLAFALRVIERQRANHRLPIALFTHQQAGPVESNAHRGNGLLELRGRIGSSLFHGLRDTAHRIA